MYHGLVLRRAAMAGRRDKRNTAPPVRDSVANRRVSRGGDPRDREERGSFEAQRASFDGIRRPSFQGRESFQGKGEILMDEETRKLLHWYSERKRPDS